MLKNLQSDIAVLQDIRHSAQRIEMKYPHKDAPVRAHDVALLALELQRLTLRIMYLEEELNEHLEVLGEHINDRSVDGLLPASEEGPTIKRPRRSPVKVTGVTAS